MQTQTSDKGMVVSPHYLASQAGLDVLKDGGNAVEACVATAAALAVVYPHMTGIGGDGFWLVTEPDGEVYGIDACGRAGRRVDLDLYRKARLNAVPWRGSLAANTVAGTISGWELALSRASRNLTNARLLQPAITLAEGGVPVTAGHAKIAADKDAELSAQRGYAAIFKPMGLPLKEGDVLRQPSLAKTLTRLADSGFSGFYLGALAEDIASDLAEAGSPVGYDDLTDHEASFVKPLDVKISGAQLFNTAPPTQGLTSLIILALFDRLNVQNADGFDHVHGLVEATKLAIEAGRNIGLGDADFMTADPQKMLDSAIELESLARSIDTEKAMPWPRETAGGDTTWFGAIDKEGRAVSTIQSTYFEFGSGLVLPKTGITWQNRGASFTLSGDGWNALKPGRKPFHTLNPALAKFDDGRTMVYGTMGGEGQPQSQAAIFTRYARFGQDLQDAVSAPRWLLGRTWGEESTSLKLENRFETKLYDALRAAGHEVEIMPELTSVMGHAGAIVRHPNGELSGASDPRSDGLAAAW